MMPLPIQTFKTERGGNQSINGRYILYLKDVVLTTDTHLLLNSKMVQLLQFKPMDIMIDIILLYYIIPILLYYTILITTFLLR